MDKIPVSVLVTTKNEERNIARCLTALSDFAQIIVIDSHSADKTCAIARECGAQVIPYEWDGRYPKKRQWCLDHLDLAHDWVFFVDADEVLTLEIIAEIRALFKAGPTASGYFVRGRYVWGGVVLRHGLINNKIALLDRRRMSFPVVDDLDLSGMGEIEGHYQPILIGAGAIGQIRAPLLHYAYEDLQGWTARHERYAAWEAQMTRRRVWPSDPVFWREQVKRILRTSPLRPTILFLHSYILKKGFLDGPAGYNFALSRKHYAQMIRRKI